VVPYKFDVPEAPRSATPAAGTTPAAPLNPQPICAVITGALYADDRILSVAHQFQVHDEVVARHPVI
jgi:hypothetical protein